MTRDRLKYAACAAAGYPENPVAQLAVDEALDRWPNSLAVVCEAAGYSADLRKWEKQLRKLREREEDRMFREVKAATLEKVRANPEAYGFAGILGALWLIFQISSIVWPIIRALFNMRYDGKDGDIQKAVGVRE